MSSLQEEQTPTFTARCVGVASFSELEFPCSLRLHSPPLPCRPPPPPYHRCLPKDDTEATVRARLDVFKTQTGPVDEWYRKELPRAYRRIDITGGAQVMNPLFEAALGIERPGSRL